MARKKLSARQRALNKAEQRFERRRATLDRYVARRRRIISDGYYADKAKAMELPDD